MIRPTMRYGIIAIRRLTSLVVAVTHMPFVRIFHYRLSATVVAYAYNTYIYIYDVYIYIYMTR